MLAYAEPLNSKELYKYQLSSYGEFEIYADGYILSFVVIDWMVTFSFNLLKGLPNLVKDELTVSQDTIEWSRVA